MLFHPKKKKKNSKHSNQFHIAFCSPIAGGKTTTASDLGIILNIPVFYEDVEENPYLSDFYKDPGKLAFEMNMYLLDRRFRQHTKITFMNRGIQDRTIYEDLIFMKMFLDQGLISQQTFKTYKSLFNTLIKVMKKPSVVIYLQIDGEESKKRLDRRGRECEKNVSKEYLTDLCNRYDKFVKDELESKSITVIRIKVSDFKEHDIPSIIVNICKQMEEKVPNFVNPFKETETESEEEEKEE